MTHCTPAFSNATPQTVSGCVNPATLLKIYLYGYLNRVQSSRRLERETQRNIELMWLTGRLAPDFKTIADFRKNNGAAIRAVCSQFVVLCRALGLLTRAVVAIDGSKFKAVNNWADRGSFSPKLTAQHARDDPPNKEYTRRGNAHQRGSEQQRDPSESKNHEQEYKEDKAEGP